MTDRFTWDKNAIKPVVGSKVKLNKDVPLPYGKDYIRKGTVGIVVDDTVDKFPNYVLVEFTGVKYSGSREKLPVSILTW